MMIIITIIMLMVGWGDTGQHRPNPGLRWGGQEEHHYQIIIIIIITIDNHYNVQYEGQEEHHYQIIIIIIITINDYYNVQYLGQEETQRHSFRAPDWRKWEIVLKRMLFFLSKPSLNSVLNVLTA